ncbi:MBL fold metallo-hydrolase RNA specificity domain-containing protein [Anoxynatronum buryatiense]|uniref:Metallo-beta-lactamase family protein n=1 Tax=Anoxynatronum buryatiense TaxID=489973 RepID=A0AA46AHQ6_9CLOT|nr:MBL fold metallo-hydrolase [Anoxynatronum buryatiense]SMP41564.1 metallo-beta-lactamase family protein [Anoxynatronum buryatiense]
MEIRFLGAAQVVTGSNILIETKSSRLLIDCGLFQGSSELEALNRKPFTYDPATIDYLFLTHAHVDHSARIPLLVKAGFRGKIFTTRATRDLAEIMLLDSAHIQENDAEWTNRKRERAGDPPIEPLYRVKDAEESLRYFHPVLYGQKIVIDHQISIRFRDAGHILGSAILELWITEPNGGEAPDTVKIVFSGDLGMPDKPLIRDPEIIEEADYLIMESTYGDRTHEQVADRMNLLMSAINRTLQRGGTVIIPSFAVGRTQELIYELNRYFGESNEMDLFRKTPVYIDSPMAISATEIFKRNAHSFDDATKELILKGDNPLSFDNLHFVRDHHESIKLNTATHPKVIISASGMCTAGRVRHHLKHNLWSPKNTVIFVGYQAQGTLGRLLKDGIKKVKLLGEQIAVKAEMVSIDGFSGHADQPALLEWLRGFQKKPKKVFLVHGEPDASNALAELIRDQFHIPVEVPSVGYAFEMEEAVLKADSAEVLLPIQRKENIKRELEQVYRQIESLVPQTERLLDEEMLKKDYDALKNKLIDLQQELIALGMIIGE